MGPICSSTSTYSGGDKISLSPWIDVQPFHLPIFQGLKIQLEGLYDQVLSSVNFQMNNSSDEIECDMTKYYTGLQKTIKAGVLFPVNMEQFVQQRYSHKQIFGAM